jgi:hypothetical protein
MPNASVLPQNLPASSVPDGSAVTLLGGRQGEGVVAELHGKYYVQTYRGKAWNLTLTATAAIPLFATNATPTFFIWNPPGSGVNCVLVRYTVGFSAGTGVAGAIGYAFVTGVNALVGTAAPVSAATTLALNAGIVGATYGGVTVGGTSATVTGTAPNAMKMYRWSNLSQGAPITTTAAIYSLSEDFDGTIIVPPSTLFCPVGNPAPAESVFQSLVGYDAPI